MKKRILLTIIPLAFSLLAKSQISREQYNQTPMQWYGIDYSMIGLVGAEGFTDLDKIVNVYFEAWNHFVILEADKYDVPTYLKKDDISINLEYVNAKNKLRAPNTLIVPNEETLKKEDIDKVLASYDFKEAGLGAMLIAEYYSKTNVAASYAFVIFDIDSKKVLHSKRYKRTAAGFGFRNYWAKTFHLTLKSLWTDINLTIKTTDKKK